MTLSSNSSTVCPTCNGEGIVSFLRRPPDPQTEDDMTCPACHGEGVLESDGTRDFVEIQVRMGLSVADGELLSDILLRCPADVQEAVCDQLWLRSVFVEQRRRTRIAERDDFNVRADRVLARLDPGEA